MSILSSTGKIYVIRTPVCGRFGMYRLLAKLTSGDFGVSWDGVSEITIVTFNKRRSMCNILHIDQYGTDKLIRKLNEGVYKIYLEETLTVDMFSGYPAALKELEEAYGVKITLTSCLTHLRRPLHQYLSDNCLIKVYQDLITEAESFANFNKALTKRSKTQKDLSNNDIILLSIYYFINSIYAIESEVVLRHRFNVQTEEFKADLLQARTDSSSLVIDAIYKLARMFVAKNPHLFNIKQNNETGELKFFGIAQRREAKAIAFLLNNEEQMRVFLTNPEVETNESSCERALRTGVLAKNSFNFIASPDGMEAFSDYQTIEATCRLNSVSTVAYLIWLASNIRYRLIKQKKQGKDDPTMFVMPGNVKLKEPEVLYEECKMYHSKNLMCYDKVDVKGLTPYDYARYLREFKPDEKIAGEGYL